VKRNRDELAADADTPRYADTTNKQPGWRFDFVILEGENPMAREVRGGQEFSVEDIKRSLAYAQHLLHCRSPSTSIEWDSFVPPWSLLGPLWKRRCACGFAQRGKTPAGGRCLDR